MRSGNIILLFSMSLNVVNPMPHGVMQWYNTIQIFLDGLHSVLKNAADDVQAYDPAGAQWIRDLEYDWLSLMGYHKGISPLLLDFYFHYYESEEFERRNASFVRTLTDLIDSLNRGANDAIICRHLNSLTADSLKQGLFSDGAIKTLLKDLEKIVENKRVCTDIIRRAQQNSSGLLGFLMFIAEGPTNPEINPSYSEL
jgi:hypothetical protein